MATTDTNGILFYETTDSLSPLQVLLNAGQQSVSDALNGSLRLFSVANDAAKTALLASRGSSATAPLNVYQQDTDTYYRHNGTAWAVYAQKLSPTVQSALGKTSAMPATAAPIIKMDRIAPTATNGAGVITVNFPVAFPNGITGVIPVTASGTAISCVLNADSVTTSNFQVVWPGIVGGTAVGFYYIAIGW